MTTKESPSTATEKASEAMSVAKEKATDVAATAKDHAAQVAGEAKVQAKSMLSDVKDRTRSSAEEQAGRAAGFLGDLAQQLRSMVDAAPDQQSSLTRMGRDGADRLESFARRLENEGLDGATRSLRTFARQRPAAFLGGAFAAGLVVGRLLRYEGPQIAEQLKSGGDSQPQGLTDMAGPGMLPPASSETGLIGEPGAALPLDTPVATGSVVGGAS